MMVPGSHLPPLLPPNSGSKVSHAKALQTATEKLNRAFQLFAEGRPEQGTRQCEMVFSGLKRTYSQQPEVYNEIMGQLSKTFFIPVVLMLQQVPTDVDQTQYKDYVETLCKPGEDGISAKNRIDFLNPWLGAFRQLSMDMFDQVNDQFFEVFQGRVSKNVDLVQGFADVSTRLEELKEQSQLSHSFTDFNYTRVISDLHTRYNRSAQAGSEWQHHSPSEMKQIKTFINHISMLRLKFSAQGRLAADWTELDQPQKHHHAPQPTGYELATGDEPPEPPFNIRESTFDYLGRPENKDDLNRWASGVFGRQFDRFTVAPRVPLEPLASDEAYEALQAPASPQQHQSLLTDGRHPFSIPASSFMHSQQSPPWELRRQHRSQALGLFPGSQGSYSVPPFALLDQSGSPLGSSMVSFGQDGSFPPPLHSPSPHLLQDSTHYTAGAHEIGFPLGSQPFSHQGYQSPLMGSSIVHPRASLPVFGPEMPLTLHAETQMSAQGSGPLSGSGHSKSGKGDSSPNGLPLEGSMPVLSGHGQSAPSFLHKFQQENGGELPAIEERDDEEHLEKLDEHPDVDQKQPQSKEDKDGSDDETLTASGVSLSGLSHPQQDEIEDRGSSPEPQGVQGEVAEGTSVTKDPPALSEEDHADEGTSGVDSSSSGTLTASGIGVGLSDSSAQGKPDLDSDDQDKQDLESAEGHQDGPSGDKPQFPQDSEGNGLPLPGLAAASDSLPFRDPDEELEEHAPDKPLSPRATIDPFAQPAPDQEEKDEPIPQPMTAGAPLSDEKSTKAGAKEVQPQPQAAQQPLPPHHFPVPDEIHLDGGDPTVSSLSGSGSDSDSGSGSEVDAPSQLQQIPEGHEGEQQSAPSYLLQTAVEVRETGGDLSPTQDLAVLRERYLDMFMFLVPDFNDFKKEYAFAIANQIKLLFESHPEVETEFPELYKGSIEPVLALYDKVTLTEANKENVADMESVIQLGMPVLRQLPNATFKTFAQTLINKRGFKDPFKSSQTHLIGTDASRFFYQEYFEKQQQALLAIETVLLESDESEEAQQERLISATIARYAELAGRTSRYYLNHEEIMMLAYLNNKQLILLNDEFGPIGCQDVALPGDLKYIMVDNEYPQYTFSSDGKSVQLSLNHGKNDDPGALIPVLHRGNHFNRLIYQQTTPIRRSSKSQSQFEFSKQTPQTMDDGNCAFHAIFSPAVSRKRGRKFTDQQAQGRRKQFFNSLPQLWQTYQSDPDSLNFNQLKIIALIKQRFANFIATASTLGIEGTELSNDETVVRAFLEQLSAELANTDDHSSRLSGSVSEFCTHLHDNLEHLTS